MSVREGYTGQLRTVAQIRQAIRVGFMREHDVRQCTARIRDKCLCVGVSLVDRPWQARLGGIQWNLLWTDVTCDPGIGIRRETHSDEHFAEFANDLHSQSTRF